MFFNFSSWKFKVLMKSRLPKYSLAGFCMINSIQLIWHTLYHNLQVQLVWRVYNSVAGAKEWTNQDASKCLQFWSQHQNPNFQHQCHQLTRKKRQTLRFYKHLIRIHRVRKVLSYIYKQIQDCIYLYIFPCHVQILIAKDWMIFLLFQNG